ncbi:ATP-dependent DNA helicase, partial [Nocardiopsis sp. MG754419]|nr:ATP-dependent DNA helicase [Nocardiopsis sp. MG754419]
ALPGAVDRLRALSGGDPGGTADPVVLAATDPAHPYGAELAWPTGVEGAHRPGRTAGSLLVLDGGRPTLYLSPGRSALTFGASPALLERAARAVAAWVHEGRIDSLMVERADGLEVFGTSLDTALAAAGFHVTPKGLRLRR